MDVDADGIGDSAQGAPLVPGVRHHKNAPLNASTSTAGAADADDINVPNTELDTPQTDAAIDDIVAQEADEVLAAQDAGIERQLEAAVQTGEAQTGKGGHPIFWFIIVLLVVLIGASIYVLTSPGLTLPFGL